MANVPQPVTLTNSSVNILNAIRNSATIDYRNYVPYATEDGDSIRGIGAIIMDYPALQNEFLNALIGRIGLVIVTSKSYQNPWSVFKKGVMEFGETVEELFVNIANVQNYNPEDSETSIFSRNIPDVKSAFHVVNYKKLYPVTIQNDQLRSAFLSWDGISDLIAKITDSLYTSMNYDEYQTMKYLIAKAIINGQMEIISVSGTISEDVTAFKSISNDLTFYSNKHNVAGVYTSTLKDDQYLIIDTATESQMNVEVLATAFNMDKAEFMGHVILVDGFGNLDTARLNELFYDDPAYEEIGSDDLTSLNLIPAVIVDKNWFMVYDQMMQFTENFNGKGLYWNYFLHT